MKICFTINCMRNNYDFRGYSELLNRGLFQGIEIFYPYNVSPEQKELYTNNIKELVLLHNPEVVLHLPHGGNNNFINSNGTRNLETIKRMEEAIVYASNFGATKLTLHLGASYQNYDRLKLINQIIEEVQKLSDLAANFKMCLMIENMPGFNEIGYGIEEMQYILDNCHRPNVKFILDTGHAHVSNSSISEFILTLKKYLYHIHFSDNDGISDQHKRIGAGDIDFISVFKALNSIKYSELHCLEILFKDYTDLEGYLKDIKKYQKYYKR